MTHYTREVEDDRRPERITSREDAYRKIINHFGVQSQIEKAREELEELDEVLRSYRAKRDPVNVAAEMADVLVMLNQLMIIYNFSYSFLSALMDYKIERTLRRIEDAEGTDKKI